MSDKNLAVAIKANIGGNVIELAEGTGMALRHNKKGKEIGSVLIFNGSKTLSELRAEGQTMGLKGAKLRLYVEASYAGDVASAAWTRHAVALEAVRKAGAVPIDCKPNAKGDSYTFQFKVATESAKAEAQAAKDAAAAEAMAKVMAQNEALLAELAALRAAKK
jgi:hypothetical protein